MNALPMRRSTYVTLAATLCRSMPRIQKTAPKQAAAIAMATEASHTASDGLPPSSLEGFRYNAVLTTTAVKRSEPVIKSVSGSKRGRTARDESLGTASGIEATDGGSIKSELVGHAGLTKSTAPDTYIGLPDSVIARAETGDGAAGLPAVIYASPARTGKKIPHPSWQAQHANIIKMREARDAPVDSMGCERCSDLSAEPRVQRFQTLVSLMLSSQTKDQITHAATKRLLEYGFTPEKLAATSEEKLAELIYPVGFYRRKAEYIKKTSQILLDDYGGDIPDTIEKLCKLNGVGPKMAYIAMNSAWNKPVGIGVDTHVHRISNRLGWVKTDTPEQTREALQSWMPEDLWAPLNILLVGFGQQICQPVRPLCDGCLNKAICPVGTGMRSPSVTPKRKDLEW